MATTAGPEPPWRRVVSIHGVPRSGTSWLGQIFNSHPDVAYRYQPLFSYAHKDAIGLGSSREEIRTFLDAVYCTTDDFVLQRAAGRLGRTPDFAVKHPDPAVMVMKMVRYHHLLPFLLEEVPELVAIGVVRHPCAVVNSFLSTPREWDPTWSRVEEWRDAPRKNRGRPEEYYGFTRWKDAATEFLALAARHPTRFRLVRYEDVAAEPARATADLFALAGLDVPPQTTAFLRASQAEDDVVHDHGVFKSPAVVGRWLYELEPQIRDAIDRELRGGPLERFL